MVIKYLYMKIKQLTKTFILSLAFGALFAGGVTFATYTWSTSWISSGATISATELKNNLDYLYNQKSDKPPVCTGGDKALQWNGSVWSCATIEGTSGGGGSTATPLTGGTHDSDDCISAGGTMFGVGSGQICKFVGGSCPSGWTQHQSWANIAPKSCNGNSSNPFGGTCYGTSCTTSSGFANSNRRTCSYEAGHWHGFDGDCNRYNETCSATSKTEIGCK